MKKPNLFLVGPAKSGTTAIYEFLKQHPNIFMSSKKETNFFLHELENYKMFQFMQPDLYAEYLGWFQDATNEKIIGEASVFYFGYEEVPERIKSFNPDAKIIAGLREPNTSLRSRYYFFSNGEPYSDFERKHFFTKEGAVNPRLLSFPLIERYYHIFGENFRVYWFEDFKKDPLSLMKKIYVFLGVDDSFSPELKIVNKTYPVSPLIATLLRPFHMLPIWTGKVGINQVIKRYVGSEKTYRLFNDYYRQNLYAIKQKLSSGKAKDLAINPELMATLEEDYQKALNYCREKNILL